MEKIIAQIQTLHGDLVTRLGEVDTLRKKLLSDGLNLTQKIADSDVRAKDISAREIAVKFIEDVQALSIETSENQKKIATDKQQLHVERTAFQTYQAQFKKESANSTGILNAGIQANKIEKERLAEAEKALKEKEKNLRSEIIDQLTKKLK